MSNFEMVLACYQSGQMSEEQWQMHRRDELFAAWLLRKQEGRS